MRYRIKIITYKNNRIEYYTQFYKGWRGGWTTLDSQGETGHDYSYCEERSQALRRIDLHYMGNTTIQKIEFEYITKK